MASPPTFEVCIRLVGSVPTWPVHRFTRAGWDGYQPQPRTSKDAEAGLAWCQPCPRTDQPGAPCMRQDPASGSRSVLLRTRRGITSAPTSSPARAWNKCSLTSAPSDPPPHLQKTQDTYTAQGTPSVHQSQTPAAPAGHGLPHMPAASPRASWTVSGASPQRPKCICTATPLPSQRECAAAPRAARRAPRPARTPPAAARAAGRRP